LIECCAATLLVPARRADVVVRLKGFLFNGATMLKLMSSFGVATALLSACATAPEGPPPEVEWRREMIVQIGTAASIPSHTDHHCLDAITPAARQRNELLVLYFKVGRARYYQAFPTAPDEGWKVGDKMMFDSQTCQIKRAGKLVARSAYPAIWLADGLENAARRRWAPGSTSAMCSNACQPF
jgi:hypothetical protein